MKLLLLLISVIFIFEDKTNAATIEIYESPHCMIKMEGSIDVGDLSKLEVFLRENDLENSSYVCLNSGGGHLREALKIAEFLFENGFGTRIDKGHSCLSACAFMFMAGLEFDPSGESAHTNRSMHPTAVLGFHRPVLDVSDGNFDAKKMKLSFELAIESTLNIVALANNTDSSSARMISPDLLRKMLSHQGENFYYINTIEQIGKWNIGLIGANNTLTEDLTKEDAFHACRNAKFWSSGRNVRQNRYLDFNESGERLVSIVPYKGIETTKVFNMYVPGAEDNGYGCSLYLTNSDYLDSQYIDIHIGDCLFLSADSPSQLKNCETRSYDLEEYPHLVIPSSYPIKSMLETVSGNTNQLPATNNGRKTCFVLDSHSNVIDSEKCATYTEKRGERVIHNYVWPSGGKTVLEIDRIQRVFINGIRTKFETSAKFGSCVKNQKSGNSFCYME